MTGSDSHKQAWGLGQQVRSDDSIGRQEDIGTLAPPRPAPRTRAKAKPAATAAIKPGKPVRVTLNIPPGLYRQLRNWTNAAADTIGVPQVSQQDAMRAMIHVITGDEAPSCSARVLAELRPASSDLR